MILSNKYNYTDTIILNDLYIGNKLKDEAPPEKQTAIISLLGNDLLKMKKGIADKKSPEKYIFFDFYEAKKVWNKHSNHNALEVVLWNDPYKTYHIKTAINKPYVKIPEELTKRGEVVIQLRGYTKNEETATNLIYLRLNRHPIKRKVNY